jgi:hypothetical protein
MCSGATRSLLRSLLHLKSAATLMPSNAARGGPPLLVITIAGTKRLPKRTCKAEFALVRRSLGEGGSITDEIVG